MTSIKAVVEDFLGHNAIAVQEAADRHYSPDFRQRTNGEWAERSQVLDRLTELRAMTADAQITVLDELIDGQRYAERHLIELHTTDGQHIRQEVYVFAHLDPDGRLSWIEELTRPLPSSTPPEPDL